MRTVAKRVLVTGGAGFLGSHLCERLIAQGHDVLCVDNYFTGRKANIAHLLQEPNFEPITRHGSGNQTRAFCYVDGLIEGLSPSR
jgi:nucleoside-diphosphate-sugar epimerase